MIKLKSLIKEIVNIILESHLMGEWWFEHGQSIAADGDIGDTNHEGYVIESLKREIVDELGGDASGYEYIGDFSDVAKEIYENIGDDLTPNEKEAWLGKKYASAIGSYINRKGDRKLKEKFLYAFDSSKDAREYALVHWGWQRVKTNVVQTQTLTKGDLQNITNGLCDAYGEELENTDESRVSEDNPRGEHTFYIEVMATRSLYEDVPWSVLSKDDPTSLNKYRRRY